MICQQTLRQEAIIDGVGLHTGAEAHLRLTPAPADHGIQIRLPGCDEPFRVGIHAHVSADRCTSLGQSGQVVHTVEHVLSALMGCGVDNCIIEVDGGEAPVMDGSAALFVTAIDLAGVAPLDAPRRYFAVEEPVWVEANGSSILALPSETLHITYGIDFNHPALGQQLVSLEMTEDAYRQEIAPARTFGFLNEVEELRRRGLAMGGSLDNAVIFGDEGCLSPLRFPDEPVRHKVLDLLGDLALLGLPLRGHLVALKTSHRLNASLVRRLLERRRT